MGTFPGSLPEGAGRGGCHASCRPETVSGRAIFIAPTQLKNRFPLPFNGRHSLSLAFARQLPQRGSRDWLSPFIGVLAKIRGFGRFSSPLRNSECLTAPTHRSTLPQSRIRSTAPSEREPGGGAYHSTYRPEAARLRAIFIAPTKLKRFWFSPFIGALAFCHSKIVLTKWSIDDRLSIEVDRL